MGNSAVKVFLFYLKKWLFFVFILIYFNFYFLAGFFLKTKFKICLLQYSPKWRNCAHCMYCGTILSNVIGVKKMKLNVIGVLYTGRHSPTFQAFFANNSLKLKPGITFWYPKNWSQCSVKQFKVCMIIILFKSPERPHSPINQWICLQLVNVPIFKLYWQVILRDNSSCT